MPTDSNGQWVPDYEEQDPGAPVYDEAEEERGPEYQDNSFDVVFEEEDQGSGQ